MHPGQVLDVSVTVRNMGDISWTGAQLFQFGQEGFRAGEVLFGSGSYLIDDSQNGIPTYGGIFRGQPITFTIQLIAPTTPGSYLTHWSMFEGNVGSFGQELDWTINVVPEPSSIALAATALLALAFRPAIRRRRMPPDKLAKAP